jgi:hypothetical protein
VPLRKIGRGLAPHRSRVSLPRCPESRLRLARLSTAAPLGPGGGARACDKGRGPCCGPCAAPDWRGVPMSITDTNSCL